MKVYGFAPLLLAIPSASASKQVAMRGAEDKQITSNARKLATEALEFHRSLGQVDNPYDGGAGCNCAKDAVKYISAAHADALQGVPMVTMAMLEKHKDDIWDEEGEYEPLVYYKYVTEIVEDIVKWANCVLLQIDCNQCVDEPYSSSDDDDDDDKRRKLAEKKDAAAEGGRRKLHVESAHEGISHFECCCTVAAVKKLVIEHINDFFLKALLNPGGAEFVRMNLDTLFHSLIKAINMLVEDYEPDFLWECEEPEFPPTPELYKR